MPSYHLYSILISERNKHKPTQVCHFVLYSKISEMRFLRVSLVQWALEFDKPCNQKFFRDPNPNPT